MTQGHTAALYVATLYAGNEFLHPITLVPVLLAHINLIFFQYLETIASLLAFDCLYMFYTLQLKAGVPWLGRNSTNIHGRGGRIPKTRV